MAILFNSSNYTTDYDCQLQFGGNQILGANTEQEFLFEEGWDAGFSSIRLVPNGNPQTLNGTLLEDGTRVKPLNWKLSTGGGGRGCALRYLMMPKKSLSKP